MNKPYIEGEQEIPKILEEARTIAHDIHTSKLFEGFTETEVMKGFTVVSIAFHHIVRPGIKLETIEDAKSFYDMLEAAGINIDEAYRAEKKWGVTINE